MRNVYVWTALVICWLAGGCNMINPADPVPTYIRIDSFSFAGNAAMGSSSHNINVAYVYLNNQAIGIFDLPATVPVILDKPGKILVTPGIYLNGLRGFPVQYPFYRSDTFTLAPAPGQVITPKLTTGYFSPSKVLYYVDFDGTAPGTGNLNPFILLNGDTSITRTSLPGEVLEGAHSGIISLTNGQDTSENTNTDPVRLAPNTDIYLEIDYKSTVSFTVGLSTTVAGAGQYAYLAGFYPADKWTKVYVSLRSFVSTYQGTEYYLLLRAVKENNADGYVLFDNIKIVSF